MSFSPSSSLGFPLLQQQASAMDLQDGVVSKPVAVSACVAMALLYVASLYAPTVLLRLPPPSSLNSFMIRRFLCAAVSTVLSLFLSALILPVCTLPLPFLFFDFCAFWKKLAYLGLIIIIFKFLRNITSPVVWYLCSYIYINLCFLFFWYTTIFR